MISVLTAVYSFDMITFLKVCIMLGKNKLEEGVHDYEGQRKGRNNRKV